MVQGMTPSHFSFRFLHDSHARSHRRRPVSDTRDRGIGRGDFVAFLGFVEEVQLEPDLRELSGVESWVT